MVVLGLAGEGAFARECAPDDQGVDFVCSFVGVDGFGVGMEPGNISLERDSVAAEHRARFAIAGSM